jgi:hypothetical protein
MVDLAFNLTVGSDNPACRERPLFAWTGSRPDQGLIPPRTLGEDRHQVAIAVVAVREPLRLDLLARSTSGDWPLAAKLVIWAGGAGCSYKQGLRDAFTSAVDEKKSAFSKTVRQGLTDLELLPQPRKNILQNAERIFDR